LSLCSAKVLSQEDSKFANPILQGVKKLFLHFKRYNLAICVVNYFETFSIPYFNNPKQDCTIESQKTKNKNQFMQFTLKVAVLEYYFLNHSQGNLGINLNNK
jgi:ABC-type long-subunit fatty acid transport system fused permease/ATPase subunit